MNCDSIVVSKDDRKKKLNMKTYQIITRNYYESMNSLTMKKGKFIAQGQWADGHLAYSLLDENNEVIEEDQCMYNYAVNMVCICKEFNGE